MTPAMPEWLVKQLETATGREVGGRYVHTRRCPSCASSVLAGLAGDWCALRAVVDPVPVGAVTEALALLAGRQSYSLSRGPAGFELTPRDRWQISGRRDMSGWRHDVVIEHRCGTPPGAAIATRLAPPPSINYGDTPPF